MHIRWSAAWLFGFHLTSLDTLSVLHHTWIFLLLLFSLLLDGQAVHFRLASCGQDSHLKIWTIIRSSSGGKATYLYLHYLHIWFLSPNIVKLYMYVHRFCVADLVFCLWVRCCCGLNSRWFKVLENLHAAHGVAGDKWRRVWGLNADVYCFCRTSVWFQPSKAQTFICITQFVI